MQYLWLVSCARMTSSRVEKTCFLSSARLCWKFGFTRFGATPSTGATKTFGGEDGKPYLRSDSTKNCFRQQPSARERTVLLNASHMSKYPPAARKVPTNATTFGPCTSANRPINKAGTETRYVFQRFITGRFNERRVRFRLCQ